MLAILKLRSLIILNFQAKAVLQQELDGVNALANSVCQLRELVNNPSGSSPVDAPPTDPDVWPPPAPLAKKTAPSGRSKTVGRKSVAVKGVEKVDKNNVRKSTSQMNIATSSKRASSVGCISKKETSVEEVNAEDKAVCFYLLLCFLFRGYFYWLL